MAKLINLTDINIHNFIGLLMDSKITVYENIQGSKLYFRYNGKDFDIIPRSIDNEPLSKIDYVLQKYYQFASDYLNSLPDNIKNLLNRKYYFLCEYFVDTKPSYINYDYIPKNGLILTAIVKNGKHYNDLEEIQEFADLLNIDSRPVIYSGKLTDKQIQLIEYFLNTNEKDLPMIFGEDNFASFFYKTLNPSIKHSVLSNSYNDNLDKIIINIEDSDEFSFAILNPLYNRIEKPKKSHIDVYSILLVDFIEFCQLLDIKQAKPNKNSFDELYLEMICALFNAYCKDRADKVKNYDFDIPAFFLEDKHTLNIELIPNKTTKKWLEDSPKLAYMFKMLLTTLKTKYDKPFGIITDNILQKLNKIITDIFNCIDTKLNYIKQSSLNGNLLSFDDFFKVEYPQDSIGNIYPAFNKKIGSDIESGSKKELGKGKITKKP